ncbi:ACP phosphodiesterase [Pantoea sp. At-9b]|uniref:acyl carrier protein phosphodiesterase n=1 Tax=Pantoea sp. (strain At-9b) TaxID=592316 RepID=UPI0001B3EE3C|nr:ACP phosphodiesterase [Pantoea sp. At-9b]ADU68233.1 (Acyl-carrier-protein) phosphodiesterase [Pantoea sp. At-9b]
MNFLAHLHLAQLADSSLLGNLMADFVRGNPHQQWSTPIADGILLHRRLDSLTDNLPEVREARQWFRAETRRVAPITLDVIWDHFLARHWDRFHPAQSLAAFSAAAEREITPQLSGTPAGFVELNAIMWRERWLEHYAEPTRLARVLSGMAQRRPRLAALRDSYQDFVENYAGLEQQFFQLYPRLMELARTQQL